MKKAIKTKKRILEQTLAVFVYVVLAIGIMSRVSDVLDFTVIIENRYRLFQGGLLTLFISLLSLVSSTVLGFMIFLLSESKNGFIKSLANLYKEIVMGTPLLVLVFVVVYIIGVAFGIRNRMFLGFISLSLYMSPYMANVFEGGYATIDYNQFIVMDFYHFNVMQRYWYIIIPQMIKPVIPGLINNLSGIIKGTSILSTIAISEIFYTTQVISNQSYRYIEGYFLLWFVYLVITIPLSRLAKYASAWND